MSLASSFKDRKISVFDERDHAAEASGALLERKPFQFAENLSTVGRRVLVLSGVAGGMDARCPVERIDLETRIVGEAVLLEIVPDSTGFLDRVPAKGLAGFRKVSGKTFRGGGVKLKLTRFLALDMSLLVMARRLRR